MPPGHVPPAPWRKPKTAAAPAPAPPVVPEPPERPLPRPWAGGKAAGAARKRAEESVAPIGASRPLPAHTVHVDDIKADQERKIADDRERTLGKLHRDQMRPKRAKTKIPSATIQYAAGLAGDAPDPTPTPQVSDEDRVRQLMGHLQDDVNTEQVAPGEPVATKPVTLSHVPCAGTGRVHGPAIKYTPRDDDNAGGTDSACHRAAASQSVRYADNSRRGRSRHRARLRSSAPANPSDRRKPRCDTDHGSHGNRPTTAATEADHTDHTDHGRSHGNRPTTAAATESDHTNAEHAGADGRQPAA